MNLDRTIRHYRIYNIPKSQNIGAYVITYIARNRINAMKYIGSTKQLRGRFWGHKRIIREQLLFIDVYEANTIEFARQLEIILIFILSPICRVTNKIFPLTKDEQNLLEELKENDTYDKLLSIGEEDIKFGYRYLGSKYITKLNISDMKMINLENKWK